MRTHGWAGSAPASDDEAVERILDAADEVINASEDEFHVADVARTLGISRQTVYNHFPGSGALLEAAAIRTALRFTERITERLAGVTDPVEALLEALAFTLDSMSRQKSIRLLFSAELSRASERITSPEVLRFNRELLRGFDVDWSAAGLGDKQLEELCAYMLRIIELHMIDPGNAGSGKSLRAYLRRWVGPVFITEVESRHSSSPKRRRAV